MTTMHAPGRVRSYLCLFSVTRFFSVSRFTRGAR